MPKNNNLISGIAVDKQRQPIKQAYRLLDSVMQRTSLPWLLLASLSLSSCATVNRQVPNPHCKPMVTTHAPATNRVRQPVKQGVTNVTQVSRYASVQNTPTEAQVNPLLAIASFTFPSRIVNVGQAVTHVLSTTGYHLPHKLSISVKQTLASPLPLTNRRLGPMSVANVLLVLMGADVYQLHRDALHRIVTFMFLPSACQSRKSLS